MSAQEPWLTIIGIGEDGWEGLAQRTKETLDDASVVYGGARHLSLIPDLRCEKKNWTSPFAKAVEELIAQRGKKTIVLATGDPMWFGVGSTLVKHFDASEFTILPHSSAFSLAASKMGWRLQDTECISLHGRPLDSLRRSLYPGARILALTSNGKTPEIIADLLVDEGYGESQLTVLEHLGGPSEKLTGSIAETYAHKATDLNTVAIHVSAVSNTPLRPNLAGLEDDTFRHDGKLTKREVRAVTLAKLMPVPHQLLWDVGAGCGSIAIEWLRAAKGTTAIGLEPNAKRLDMACVNAQNLGVPHLQLVDKQAPEALEDLPDPDAIFIGGGLTAPNQIEACYERLKPGGRLVANAVTLEGEQVLMSAWQRLGGELGRLNVSRISPVGSLSGWRPLMQVTQWNIRKK
ncbi:precorrin-6y C5,15-methyltransferase (decarboxylating) subunit CbiE [Flexibacterium corallicola]|uniref:precorrin-6y C5,15-methyltransferase (decarboxylating) subunit CbiE n=1 Tax=Flexibacterium corallicola TaxID=3037259 RepID=UPI00286EC89D|nr:precorrin-6y C5,15-methyltransferase (decarboxylating) subunit CbiE [Pseudovibrio sp. M1P-2-3]